MTISFHDMHDKERMYSFVGDNGENVHVAIERLYKWVQDHKFQLKVYSTPVHPHLAIKWIKTGLVSRQRSIELCANTKLATDPIIYGKEKPGAVSKIDMYLLDGRHRYIRAVHYGAPIIEAYILEPKQWLAFQVTNIPQMSQQQLQRIPVVSGPR